MNETGKHILIVCFDFPPKWDIGGRRWAKFAKYMAKNGLIIHVIAPLQVMPTEPAPWYRDVQHENINIYSVHCPQLPLIPSASLWGKMLNRFNLTFRRVISAGSPYDSALLWRNNLHRKTAKLVAKYNVQHIIATGAPFRVLYDMALFREKHPEIFLLCDYRDPWYGAHNYGMSNIGPARLAHEHGMEAKVIAVADAITAPSDLFESHPLRAQIMAKFHLLQHAADPDDFAEIDRPAAQTAPDDVVKIVYGGALYVGIEQMLIQLSEILGSPQWAGPTVEIHVYSPDVGKLSWLSQLNPAVFRLHAAVASQVLFQKIAEASAAMIILAEHNKNFHTTKFFEITLLDRPIFYLGPEGAVADSISRDCLGATILLSNFTISDIENSIREIYNWKSQNSYSLDRFSFAERTKHLLSILK